MPCQVFTQGRLLKRSMACSYRATKYRESSRALSDVVRGRQQDEAFRPHDVAMTVACGIAMKFGWKSRLPASKLQGRSCKDHPASRAHNVIGVLLLLLTTPTAPLFPSTSSSSSHQPNNPSIRHSTKTPPTTTHQHFTMATLSCTYNAGPLARAGHAFESYVFVVIRSQPHYLESIMAAPHSSPEHH